MWPILIPALIGAIAGAARAHHKDNSMLGGAAKGALIGGSLGYGGQALAGLFGGAGAGAGGMGAGATGAEAGGFSGILPQLGSFLASNYSPSAAGMEAYAPQAMADPWGTMQGPIQMLPSAMGGSIPGAQAVSPGASPSSATAGMQQLTEMLSRGQSEIPKPLSAPHWPSGVAGYGHGDMRKIEGLQMPEIPKSALPSLIAMLSRIQ